MYNYILLGLLVMTQFQLKAQSHNCETTIPYGNNAAHGAFAKVNDIQMYYETYGDSTKQPLLLIHGNGGSVKSSRCQIEQFKEDYFVIVPDSRYQGKSGTGIQELTYRLMASDYNALLSHLHIDSAYIFGQSDGAIIGLLLAIEYPVKVSKLIASAPNLTPDSTALHPWAIEEMKSELAHVDEQIAAGDTSRATLRDKVLIEKMLKHPHISMDELKQIQAPVLLVFGDADYMPLEHSLEMYRAIPKGALFIVPNSGHRTYRLEPSLFNLMAERFFNNPYVKHGAENGY